MSRISKCKSCGAEIIWIKMRTGKWMPCDAQRHGMKLGSGGKILITEGGEIITGELCASEEGANASGYESHFASCPNAATHRNK